MPPSALLCFKCTPRSQVRSLTMRVRVRSHVSALGCTRVHLGHESELGCMRVHLDLGVH